MRREKIFKQKDIELIEWIHTNATQDSRQKGKWMTVGSVGLTHRELYDRFLLTRINKSK